jgi:predicted RNase H-like nuclease (RuvC/YqgF family)
MTNNLPEPDDAPWLNLSQEEINQLRYNKQELTSYGREKIRALMEEKKLLKECRQTGRTTATTEKVLKTVFSQMTDKKTLECEIEEYALGIEQKAKEIGKLKDILDRKEQQLKQMKETDKVLIEGDTATINGIKYKRVEEPKPKKLFDVIRNLGYSVDMCYEIVDAVENCLPNRLKYDGEEYQLGWNDAITTIKDGLR